MSRQSRTTNARYSAGYWTLSSRATSRSSQRRSYPSDARSSAPVRSSSPRSFITPWPSSRPPMCCIRGFYSCSSRCEFDRPRYRPLGRPSTCLLWHRPLRRSWSRGARRRRAWREFFVLPTARSCGSRNSEGRRHQSCRKKKRTKRRKTWAGLCRNSRTFVIGRSSSRAHLAHFRCIRSAA